MSSTISCIQILYVCLKIFIHAKDQGKEKHYRRILCPLCEYSIWTESFLAIFERMPSQDFFSIVRLFLYMIGYFIVISIYMVTICNLQMYLCLTPCDLRSRDFFFFKSLLLSCIDCPLVNIYSLNSFFFPSFIWTCMHMYQIVRVPNDKCACAMLHIKTKLDSIVNCQISTA